MKPEIMICDSSGDVSRKAAELFAKLAREAIDARGVFTVALSGGSTPRVTYARLSEEPYYSRIPWERVQFFWGDERSVPPDHPESNFRMANECLVSHIPIPPENVHRMQAEDLNLERAVTAYEEQIRTVFKLGPGESPQFDLIMLGLGEDGHTASLFPSSEALNEMKRLVVATYVDRLGAYRMTVTYPVLNDARCILFLAPGLSKAELLRKVLQGPHDPTRLPSQAIKPKQGSLIWMIDQDAASLLQR